MRRRVIAALFVVCLAPLSPGQVLDQSNAAPMRGFPSNPPRPALSLHANVDYDTAQTFTAGMTGQFSRLDVQALRRSHTASPLMLEVRRTTAAGAPGESEADLLAQVAVPATRVPMWPDDPPPEPDWLTVDLTLFNLHVNEGDVLAIVLGSDEPPSLYERGYYWQSWWTGTDGYSRGDAYYRHTAGDNVFYRWAGPNVTDSGFRTFVGVPEPAGLMTALLAAGTILLRPRRC